MTVPWYLEDFPRTSDDVIQHRLNLIRTYLEQGLTISQIAEKVNVTDVTVRYCLQKYGTEDDLELARQNGKRRQIEVGKKMRAQFDTVPQLRKIRASGVADGFIGKFEQEFFDFLVALFPDEEVEWQYPIGTPPNCHCVDFFFPKRCKAIELETTFNDRTIESYRRVCHQNGVDVLFIWVGDFTTDPKYVEERIRCFLLLETDRDLVQKYNSLVEQYDEEFRQRMKTVRESRKVAYDSTIRFEDYLLLGPQTIIYELHKKTLRALNLLRTDRREVDGDDHLFDSLVDIANYAGLLYAVLKMREERSV